MGDYLSCIRGRSGLFGKGYESILDILEAFEEKVGLVLQGSWSALSWLPLVREKSGKFKVT